MPWDPSGKRVHFNGKYETAKPTQNEYKRIGMTTMRDPLFKRIRINRMLVKNGIYFPAIHLKMADGSNVRAKLSILERKG